MLSSNFRTSSTQKLLSWQWNFLKIFYLKNCLATGVRISLNHIDIWWRTHLLLCDWVCISVIRKYVHQTFFFLIIYGLDFNWLIKIKSGLCKVTVYLLSEHCFQWRYGSQKCLGAFSFEKITVERRRKFPDRCLWIHLSFIHLTSLWLMLKYSD